MPITAIAVIEIFQRPVSAAAEAAARVTVEYRIDQKDRNAFLAFMDELAHERRRDGAYRWRVFEDAAEEGRFVETFLVASWLEHLRQHERVTNADRVLQDAIERFHMAGTPKVTHLIAAEP
jgi:hypothetical protein